MKEETPTFYQYDSETKRKHVDLPSFLNYLSNLSQPEFVSKHGKNIQEHLLLLVKTPGSQEQVLQVVRFICLQFKASRSVSVLQLLRSTIGADLKFEARSQGDRQVYQENLKMVDTNEVIALPCGPVYYGPAASPTIAFHSADAMTDVADQRKHGDSKSYYNQDHQVVGDYLNQKFRVIKRDGISALFGQSAEIICIQLLEGFLEELQTLTPSVLLELMKILEYITPPLYTFYLLHLTQQIVQKICYILQLKQTQKRASKSDLQGLIYTLRSISDRWAESDQATVQKMEWALQIRVITLFIASQVSQKKLFAVKLLCEICRRSQYSSSTISSQTIEKFISEKGLLQQIYRADNHPEVVTKGEQVFLFLVKDQRLNQVYINVIFNLLDKCHQQLSKSLFNTLQRVGHKNIENNRKYLLRKIEQLPRATCFNEETFTLIQKIMISTPSAEAQSSLYALYRIMQKNYEKLKENLKARAVAVYYQVFIMGIQQGVFDHQNAMLTFKPILHRPNSSLFSFMIQNFIFRLKNQQSKQIGLKCKKTLHSTIRKLIAQQNIHKIKIDDQTKHLKILNLLLQNYEQLDQNLMSSEDLWALIKLDRKFSKFLKFYPQDVQVSLISNLISSEGKSPYDIECIIDLYQLMSSQVKAVLAPLLCEDFFKTHSLVSKYLLVRHILEIQPISIDDGFVNLQKNAHDVYSALSWVILIRQILSKQDQKGFGMYPPYEDIRGSFELTIKVVNNINVFSPLEFEFKAKNYQNLYQITTNALKGEIIGFQKLRLKFNDQNITLNQLKEKISNLSPYRNVTLDIYETQDCEWFNKGILFDKDGGLRDKIVDILKDVFKTYGLSDGKLRPEHIVKIFEKATGTQIFSEKDNRVMHIFNNYSHSGQFITLEEWINFYYQSALTNAPLVIDNLRKLGYSQQLNNDINFQLLFRKQNPLRQYINSIDGKFYHLLFKIFEELIYNNPTNLHNDIIKEFTSTLKLFPVSIHFIKCLNELDQHIFNYARINQLYYWYLSNLLQSLYYQNIQIEDYTYWKDNFENSYVFQEFLTIYERYLFQILSNGPSRYQVNIDLEIFIIQSLGKVLRNKFIQIPSLTSQSVQLAPLCTTRSSYDHIPEPILTFLPQLGQLCINICKGKRDQQIAENAVAILLDIALGNLSKNEIQVIQSLIFSEILTVRQIFNFFYYLLSTIYPQIKKDYYSIHIIKNSKATYKHCQEYFLILNKLLFTEEDDRYFQEISKLYQKQICEERYIENLSDDTETDQILLGKLKILNQIKIFNPESQINLTTISSIKQLLQKSLSEQVREILYSMTSNICDVQYSLQLMVKIMQQTNLKRNSIPRGKKKMGIMNLGCICYINSVLQQLEMIEPFRRGIISTQVPPDFMDFFREFQHIIYQLTFGQRIFLIPQNFCLNYLDNNNLPINIKQQHDADEFLNQLFDRLEHRLKNTNQDHLINNNFKGELVNVIKCEKCYQKKERIENFYILTVQIKNQANLADCLTKLIQPQIICDYFCDFCQGKVETIQKYNRFHSLPPFLFIHLQRLVFDLQTFTKIKLDHPVSFPTQINLQDFFEKQTVPQMYVLKGFVVHVGSSQGGHYYSIIKCQNGWIKFDDTRIDEWDWITQTYDKDHAYLIIYERKRQENELISQEIQIGNPQIMNIVQDDINYLMKQKIFLQPSFTKYLFKSLKKIIIPDEFISTMNQPSCAYQFNFAQVPSQLQDKLDLAYRVIILYIKLQSEMREMRINLQNSNDFIENDRIANKDANQFQYIVYFLYCILHIRPKLAYNTLQCFTKDSPNNFLLHIYMHRDKVFRESFKFILKKVAHIISAAQRDISFLVPIPQNEPINSLLQKLMIALNQVGKNPMKMLEYFTLLLELCKLDQRFAIWFQANKLGPKLIHFYLQKQSGLQGILPSYPNYLSTDRRIESVEVIINILSILVLFEADLSIQREQNLIERKAYLNIQLYRRLLNERYNCESMTNIFKYVAKDEKISEKLVSLVIENLNRFNHEDEYIYNYFTIMYCLLTIEKDNSFRIKIQRLFGVPILTIIGENDADKYLAKSPTDRICKYWNPFFKPGDQIIFSFLELLYNNRLQHNYFTLLGIMCVLKLMSTCKQVKNYVNELPGPLIDSKSYIDWIQQFVFNFEKIQKQEYNYRLNNEQKHRFLQDIVGLLRDLENSQQETKNLDFEQYHKQLSQKKQQFHIGLIKNCSQWEQVQFDFFENLSIHNCQKIEQITNITPNEIVSVRYRLLYSSDEQEMQDCAQVIEYQIDIKQKAKLYFTEFYNYTFNFDSGYYEIALPFHQNQLVALRIALLEEVTYKPQSQEKKEVIMTEQIIIKEAIQDDYLAPKNSDDFPSISDVYDQKYKTDHMQNQMRGQKNQTNEVEIQCPFCCYKANAFTSKCPNCFQEWGEMR